MKKALFLLLFPLLIFANETKVLQRVNSHVLIEDYQEALVEIKEGLRKYPNSQTLWINYIKILAANNEDMESIRNLKKIANKFDITSNRDLLEEVSWGIINKGVESAQFSIRLTSMIGAYLTHDVRAVNIILKMMRDSNAVLRSVAVQLACSYLDTPLKNEVSKLLDKEKIWLVRLEVIKAIGQMKIYEKEKELKQIVANEKSTYEEKVLAIQALVNILDDIKINEFKKLAKSNRAGLRQLACELATNVKLVDAKDDVLALVTDPISDVRISALNSIGLFYMDYLDKKSLEKTLQIAMDDTDPAVSITGCYVAVIIGYSKGDKKLSKWALSDHKETRRLASSAIAALGNRSVKLAKYVMDKSPDSYVKANIAMGLIGQRVYVKKCLDILYDFLQNEKQMWMVDNRKNPLFQVLSPSEIRHVDQIPKYPEAMDQMTRLNLLSMLAVMDDPRAQDAIKGFLKENSWGITGFAAATLLQEGDEQALELVRVVLNDSDENVKIQAALVLALLGKDENVMQVLQTAYLEADHDMKLRILEAIGHIGSVDSYNFFIDILAEPYQMLRVAIASAMIQCLNH